LVCVTERLVVINLQAMTTASTWEMGKFNIKVFMLLFVLFILDELLNITFWFFFVLFICSNNKTSGGNARAMSSTSSTQREGRYSSISMYLLVTCLFIILNTQQSWQDKFHCRKCSMILLCLDVCCVWHAREVNGLL
jgi:hypothetical protein